ncbi:hypothetical protein WK92_30155 [Burkholderia ubonensis]|nr:hypothetical protein WK82_25330 [Burkholderia ubonensis]KVW28709.1 hypothetical protein WK92_30155 [Burkholderia ubonensis]
MPAQPALAQSMTIRARARISMAPSPILVGRRFCPRFLWSAGNFFGASIMCRGADTVAAGFAYARSLSRLGRQE